MWYGKLKTEQLQWFAAVLRIRADFYRIRGFKNSNREPDPGDPKRPDPDPPFTFFNKPFYVWDVLT